MGAQNLRLTLDRDFFQFGEKDLPDKNIRNMTAFSNCIDCFPPGAELVFALGQGWVIFGKDANIDVTPMQFNISAQYEYMEKKFKELNRIDLRPYLHTEPEHNPIVEELEKLRKVLEGKN
jgi:hypothetical protein